MGAQAGQKVFSFLTPAAAINMLLAVSSVAVIAMMFVVMDKYVKNKVSIRAKRAALELVDVPPWVNNALKEKVYIAALSSGENFKLDEDAAKMVQENIAAQVAWMENVQVQITHNSFRIRGKWRKPLAIIKAGGNKFYVDSELTVLDFVPMRKLPIVTVRGIPYLAKELSPGEALELEDLAAAVAIIENLDRMDKLVCPRKPLLNEIESIDVSNYNGRVSNRFPHIVFFSRDNTQIIWGAELDNWQKYLEATDEEKLAKLYSFYKEHKSLSGQTQSIDLRAPENIMQPIDRY